MNRRDAIIGIGIVAVLAVVLILILSNKKTEMVPSVMQTHETSSLTETEKPADSPTERKAIRITNPPAEANTEAPTATPNPWVETEHSPTCEEAGYIVRENKAEGYTVIDEGKPALGHEYGEWKRNPDNGMMVTVCTRCGKEISRRAVHEYSIPRIDFTGSMEGIGKKDQVTLGFDFASSTDNFSCYSYTTWQGHNTLKYPKKNYTIRLFNDDSITEKHRLAFNGWQREHKYILKANYRDISQARNLIAANLWADLVASRPGLFETLKHTSNYGAVDGFPVVVYLNGEFHGLYTMNLHIDDDLYQMDNARDTVMIANSTEPDECRFQAEAAFTDQKNAWEVEFCGSGEDDQWAKDSLNELIRFVMKSDDETFRAQLKDYLDVDGAIDYLIFLYVTGLQNNAGKDLVLLKYHDCSVWIPSVYDMERAFGLGLDGTEYISPEVFLPEISDEVRNSGTGSLLWDRLLQGFTQEIRARYSELRQTLLEEEKLIGRVEAYMEQIPDIYQEMDLKLFPRQVPEQKPREQMIQYIRQRLTVLDQALKE